MTLQGFTVAAEVHLRQGREPQQRLAAWQAVIRKAERAEHVSNIDTEHIACAPGCGTCCAINVSILEPEALAIAAFVEMNFSPQEKTALLKRLEQLHKETAWLDDEERIMVRKPCAFLNNRQNCSIHPVRPLLCRSLTSTSPESCRDAISMLAFGEPPEVLCNLEHKKLYEQAFLGLAEALKSFNLDHSTYRLTGKLLAKLAH